jgi:hypothetical protein
MVKISNRMSREQMQEVVNEMTAWHDRKLKYENALKLICAAGMCCPQCRSMVVSMLATADRFGVLSQVVQTTMEMYQAETDSILVNSVRAACRSHGIDVNRFRIRHPMHLTLRQRQAM